MQDGPDETSRRAFDQFPIALAVLEGPEHRVAVANDACRTLLGRADVVGRPVREVLPADGSRTLTAMLDRVRATGTSEVGRAWPVRDTWVDVAVGVQHAPGGTVTGVLVGVLDVAPSERRAPVDAQRPAPAPDVVAVLQRELLPAGLPVLPMARVAAGYLIADAETAAGGDWFDALALPDGRVVLVVGDVVGHGVVAAATMGQLRAVLDERLRATAGDAGAALGAVDRVADDLPAARAATVCVAVLNPATGALTYATAGHPPPLLVPAGGEARYLPVTGGGPLGTGSAFPTARAHLEVGDLLLAYCDGVLERPGRDPRAGAVELAGAVADAATGDASADRVCARTLDLLVRATGHRDDITLLVATRRPPVGDLDLAAPAEPRILADVRARLRAWLRGTGAGEDTVSDVAHAVGELVTNAVEHAYPNDDPRRADLDAVRVHATLGRTGVLRLAVRDDGRWLAPAVAAARDAGPFPGADRGRGLEMSTALVDRLTVERGEPGGPGTTATLEHRLVHPARLLAAADLGHDVPAGAVEESLLLVLDEPTGAGRRPRVRVDGPVDALTADQLHAALAHRTRGGTRPLTVDLTGVTHLGSAGVSALFAVRRAALRGVDGQPDLVLYAPVGGVADHVLTLVGLPHATADPDHPAPTG